MSYVSRSSWKRRSGRDYTAKTNRGIKNTILFVLIVFLVFELITSMFICSYRQKSIAMEPSIPSGALVLSTPFVYGAVIPFAEIRLPGFRTPKRGDVVICTPGYYPESSWWEKSADSAVRFFTFQRKSIRSSEEKQLYGRMIKRVVGVPGDTVKMEGFQVMIKPEGKNFFFSEHEIGQIDYKTASYTPPEKLPPEFPMSGNMGEIRLGEGEYFLMGDNRSMSNDSYYWGPVDIGHIESRVLVQYRPSIKPVR